MSPPNLVRGRKKCSVKKKRMKRPQRNYDASALESALEQIEEGMTFGEASRVFGIPKSTLRFRKSPKFSKSNFGPKTVLSPEEEQILVEWIITCARKGFPRRSMDVRRSVEEFLTSHPRPNSFVGNRPGRKWLQSFLRRHPEIAARTSEAVTAASAAVSKEDVIKWFKSVEDLLVEEGVFEILLECPSRVFNGDETSFMLCPKMGKVLSKKGDRNVYEVDGAQAKTALTVMFSFSATGGMVPPMIVYPYQRIPRETVFSVPDGWGIGRSDTGWMNSVVFYEYIANVFSKHLDDQNIERPVILFLDGHKSHVTYQLSQLCSELRIVLVCLYPNATRILQPADVAAFKPLKEGWKKGVQEWRVNNPNSQLRKQTFAPVLKSVLDRWVMAETLIHGFRACGLFPWNYNNIDFSKCLGKGSSQQEAAHQETSKGRHEDGTVVLAFEDFQKIVGGQLSEALSSDSFQNDSNFSQNMFTTLKAIQNHFQNANCGSAEQQHSRIELAEQEHLPFEPAERQPDPLERAEQEPASMETSETQPSIVANATDAENLNSSRRCDIVTLKKVAVNSLDECLVYPETPKRKGVRNTRRQPFVISSQAWKLSFQEEDERKAKLQKDKEERAGARLKAKEDKQKKLKKKGDRKKKKKKTALNEGPCSSSTSETRQNLRPSVRRELPLSESEDEYEYEHDFIIPMSPTKAIVETELEPKDGTVSEVLKNIENEEDGRIYRGLCFKCGGALSKIKFGISCDICDKHFHSTCLTDFDTNKDHDIIACEDCNRMSQDLEILTGTDI